MQNVMDQVTGRPVDVLLAPQATHTNAANQSSATLTMTVLTIGPAWSITV